MNIFGGFPACGGAGPGSLLRGGPGAGLIRTRRQTPVLILTLIPHLESYGRAPTQPARTFTLQMRLNMTSPVPVDKPLCFPGPVPLFLRIIPSLFLGKGKRGTTGTAKGSVVPEFSQPLPGPVRVFRDPGSWIRPPAGIPNGLNHIRP